MPDKPQFIGYHETSALPVKPGDMVRVPKGTLIRTTGPGDNIIISGKSQRVRVHHMLCGQGVPDGHPHIMALRDVTVVNPYVVWAGSGGYWHECDVNDVEWEDEA